MSRLNVKNNNKKPNNKKPNNKKTNNVNIVFFSVASRI